MKKIFGGMIYLYEGFKLITRSEMRPYVLIPFIINFLLFIGLFFLLKQIISLFNVWIAQYLPIWLHWLNILCWILFFISFFAIFFYTFMTFANLIAAPFNSLLAEKIEWYLTGKEIEKRAWYDLLKDIPRILHRQFRIVLYYLSRALLIGILFLIPVVSLLAIPLWLIFNAWFLCLTYLDYPADNHRIPLSKIQSWQQCRRWLCLQFGMSIMLVSIVPIVNFFILPAAVAAATKLWVTENN